MLTVPLLSLLRVLARVNAAVGNVGRVLAAALIASMTLAVLLQVFFRYMLNNSLSWSEETSIFMMIWVAFLVAPWAYRYGGFIAIDMLVDLMPRPLRKILSIALNLLVLWILYRFFFESLTFVERGMIVRANTINLPIGYVRAIMPVSIFAMILVAVELILHDVLSLVSRAQVPPHPHLAEPIEPE